ncbi:uncharacterized protein METZ01_LOCUS428179 [marine metagenome]|uniref:Uncharacterized protein n=1 Tax=marine metagenome TaxID=408172 RepID=A0A382XXF4_9ZZZZ
MLKYGKGHCYHEEPGLGPCEIMVLWFFVDTPVTPGAYSRSTIAVPDMFLRDVLTLCTRIQVGPGTRAVIVSGL